jgi:membrane protein implicated in regulation of membrane protease activity
MFYSLELQMAGVILLSAMTVGGISLWLKRRKEQQKLDAYDDEAQNI